jgi:RimJ/RimL family protein N-acetyltransferase
MLRTEHLLLVPAQIVHLESLIDGQSAYDGLYSSVADGYLEFSGALEQALDDLKSGANQPEWATHLFTYPEDDRLIGLGGYHSAPNTEGVVELGYGIAPAYRGRGFATEAAQALIDHAFSYDEVRIVIAHTLARASASTRVLMKVGLLPVTEMIDPQEGPIWRWEIRRT